MKYIALTRTYAAGGHSVGAAVAKKLGVELYDKDIISKTAEAMGLDKETIEKKGDQISGKESFLHKLGPVTVELRDQIFYYRNKVILELAQNGPCVFLDGYAEVVLDEAGIDCLRVFLFSGDAHRAMRAAELLGTTDPEKIAKTMKKIDQQRDNYYQYYTGRHRGDYHNYELMLDTGALGYDTCVDIICAAAQK